MPIDPLTGNIRAKVVCVFRRQNKILVGEAFDPIKKQMFYCPPGGGIEFGESSEAALHREIKEELDSELKNPVLLGVLENMFTFADQEGHEIVFVYDAELVDQSRYDVASFKAVESNGEPFNALWLDLKNLGPDTPPVYPTGLLDLLTRVPLFG